MLELSDIFLMLPGYYVFLGGICFITLGAVLNTRAPGIRERMKMGWLISAVVALGLARIFMAFSTLLPDGIFYLFEAVLRVFAAHSMLEFIRQVLLPRIGLLLHLPLFLVLMTIYGFSGGRASLGLIIAIGGMKLLTCLAGIKAVRQLPTESRRLGIAAFIIAIPTLVVQGFSHYMVAGLNDSYILVNEKWLPKFYLDLVSLIAVMILVLLAGILRERAARTHFQSSVALYIPSAIATAVLLTTVFGLHLSHQLAINQNKNAMSQLEKSVENLSKIIDQRMAFASTSSAIMGSAPIMSTYLANPDSENLMHLNGFVDTFSAANPGAICYVLDSAGIVRASSDLKQLFLNKNLAFRSYYKEAMAGRRGLEIDIGVLTNTLGLYSSFPIRKGPGGPVLGVCAVKRNLDDVENTLKMFHPAMMLDASGTVNLASSKSMLRMKLPAFLEIASATHLLKDLGIVIPGIDSERMLCAISSLETMKCRIVLMRHSEVNFSQAWILSVILLIVIIFLAVLNGFSRYLESMRSIENAQKRFKTLFDNAPESIFVVSLPTLRIVEANQSMIQQFLLAQSPIGMKYFDLMPEPRKMLANSWQSASKQLFKHQRDFRKQNGEVFAAEVTGSIIDFNGERALLIILHDITAHCEVENRLREAKNAAEEANSLKARFFANASHEIRTPMTAIIGLTELASASCQDDQQKRLLGLILTSGKAMLSLLNDILELAQIESGKLEFHPVQFNLPLLLNDLIEIIRFQADKKSVRAELKIAGVLPEMVIADPDRIRQILMNLLANAVRYTRHGVICLTANVPAPENGQSSVEFTVSDTGMGISEEMQRNLFGAFVFNDPYVKSETHNGNLGLSISKQLIDLMGGSIKAESQPGEGTTFRISIPIKINAAVEATVHSTPAENFQLVKGGRPLRFLIADDNDINLFLASSIIERFQGVSTCVNDGVEALEALGRESFDAILLDIQMPRLDGIATLKELRKTGSTIPVVAVSAFASDQEKNIAREAGANGYLAKPYFPEDLLGVLRDLLGGISEAAVVEPVRQNGSAAERQSGFELKQINLNELELRVLKKPENIVQINDIYQRRSGILGLELDECLHTGGFEHLRETAHSIKGLAGMLAANATFELAREIEFLSRDGKFADAAALIPALKKQLQDIAEDLVVLTSEIQKKLV